MMGLERKRTTPGALFDAKWVQAPRQRPPGKFYSYRPCSSCVQMEASRKRFARSLESHKLSIDVRSQGSSLWAQDPRGCASKPMVDLVKTQKSTASTRSIWTPQSVGNDHLFLDRPSTCSEVHIVRSGVHK